MEMKEWLLGKTRAQLQEIVRALDMPSFTAGQIAQWIYQKRVADIEAMTNLSKAFRSRLAETYQVGGFAPSQVQVSSDGTKKYLFPTLCDAATGIEAVMIPDHDRATLCISSQVGCQMGCAFCMTARMGFHGHLTAGEIVGQVLRVEESSRLTNIVYMGMGEPLNNWGNVLDSMEILTQTWGLAYSPRRITLSTVGILPQVAPFMEKCQAHLAVSLHNPFDLERAALMPSQRAYPLAQVIQTLRQYDWSGQRRLSFEYIMFDGWNDTPRHAAALLHLINGLECRINLIRFHEIPDFDKRPASEASIEAFKTRLNRGGVVTTVRASRGQDIMAACGLLSGHHAQACAGAEPTAVGVPDKAGLSELAAKRSAAPAVVEPVPRDVAPSPKTGAVPDTSPKPFQKALSRMQQICSRQEQCTSDIRRRLASFDLSVQETDRLLASLEEEGYLNPLRYAAAFVNDKSALQGWGPVKLAFALREKGLASEVIEQALAGIDNQALQYRLVLCLQRKAQQLKENDPQLRRAKLIRFAVSRGYTYAQIMDALSCLG